MIKAAVAEVFADKGINILAITKIPALGLKKGNIIDIEGVSKSIDEALIELERLTGIELYSAVIGFSGHNMSSLNNHAIVAVGNHNYNISIDDKERVLHSARNIALPPDKTMVQIIERQYIIDGYEGVKDPVGMAGNRLEVEIAIIIAATAALQNIHRSTHSINLQINGIVYNPLLEKDVVLMPAEQEMGVVLINMGAGLTEISYFKNGNLLYTSVLPVGGEYITRDLAIVLRTSIEEAERIKREYGNAYPESVNEEDLITIRNISETDTRTVSYRVVTEIIAARIYEIMEMINAELNNFDCLKEMPGGIVLTGGSVLLKNINVVMEKFFDLPVRIGFPDRIQGLSSEYRNPELASVIGALLYGAQNMDISYQNSKGISKIVDRISYFIRDLFS